MKRILLVNDDGIDAKGLSALCEVAKEFGDVTVVAPMDQQSAASHAITINRPISFTRKTFDSDVKGYAVDGTPVDCMKMALNLIVDEKPDLVLSGINWGENLGASVFYSGTLAAAIEGVIHGIPSFAFSLVFGGPEDYTFSQEVVRQILEKAVINDLPEGIVFNVNIPNIAQTDCEGTRITTQASSYWQEEYTQIEAGKDTYKLAGKLITDDTNHRNDLYAIETNYVSITPLHLRYTDYDSIDRLDTIFHR